MPTLDIQITTADKVAQLGVLRTEHTRLTRDLAALSGNGWSVDISRMHAKGTPTTDADIDRVLSGHALEAPTVLATREELERRLRAVSGAIQRLSKEVNLGESVRLQAEADSLTATLRDDVTAALTASATLRALQPRLLASLQGMKNVLHERDILRGPDAAAVPGVRRDVNVEDAADCIARGIELIKDAEKSLNGTDKPR